MADLLGLSARLVDEGVVDEPSNRVTGELSEIAPGLALVEAFSHVAALDTGDGLALFDTSSVFFGREVVEALRGWSAAPVRTVVYTHGHVDHVGGSGAIAADADGCGHPRPRVVAHRAVNRRFERYDATNGLNLAINARQFGGTGPARSLGMGDGGVRFLPPDVLRPTECFDEALVVRVGSTDLELHHDRGETDDHVWAWLPDRRAVFVGDLLTWVFPNCGNPQKVQRYPLDWARALRKMQALRPELLVPAHGLPIGGVERVDRVLGDVAGVLEDLVGAVLERMNAGLDLDTIVHEVTVDPDTLALPYLRPTYDEPEFVVRSVWRLYGGWWDGDPAALKPPSNQAVAREVAALAGGVDPLVRRATELAEAGDLRLACRLVEWAAGAAPDDPAVHEVRAAVYRQRRSEEVSLMSKGVFTAAARESDAVAGTGPDETRGRLRLDLTPED